MLVIGQLYGIMLKFRHEDSEYYVHGRTGKQLEFNPLKSTRIANITPVHPIPMKLRNNYMTLSLTPYSKPKERALTKHPANPTSPI